MIADEEFQELPKCEPAWAALDRVTAYRKQLLAFGYSPVPVNGKRIQLSDWQNIRATPAIIETWATTRVDHLNTGVLCAYTPFIDIDVTDETVAEEIEALLESEIERSGVRVGLPPKRAIPFRTDTPFKKMVVQFKAPSGTLHKVEVLGDGQQVVVNGIHPDTHKPYRWHGNEPGPKLRREDLPPLTAETAAVFLAAAAEVMRSHGWTEVEGRKINGANKTNTGAANRGNESVSLREHTYARAALDGCFEELAATTAGDRNNILYKKSFRIGTMVARGWLTRAEAEMALFDGAAACGLVADDGEGQARKTIESGLGDGITVPCPDLDEQNSDGEKWEDATSFKKTIGGETGRQAKAEAFNWDEPDVSILDDRRGDLPEFSIEVLSPACRAWVERAAHGSGVTPAHVAVPLIGIVSSLIGTARRVQASRSWTQPLTLWAAVIGFSGSGKTPGLDTVRRALAMVERSEREKIANAQRSHEEKIEAAKAVRAQWKKQVEEMAANAVVDLNDFRAKKSAAPPMPPEAVVPGPFVTPRLYVSDSTIERLAVLLTARQRGMLLIGDELASLFLNMSRYSSGSDREFWLEAWNGGPFTVERMSREPIRVDYLLVGMVGGFQPDKLSRSFSGDHDGIYGRVIFAWPSEPPHRELANDVFETEPDIVNALSRVNGLVAGENKDGDFAPRAVALSPEALAAFERFRELAYDKKQTLDGREREWMAKAQAHVLRMAGTLEFLSWAFVGGNEPAQIDVQSVEAAAHLVWEYFWPHSRAALRQIGLSEKHVNARKVLRWLAASSREEFSREDVRVTCLAKTLYADQTQDLIDALVKAGWCRELSGDGPKKRGRPVRRWAVNPRLKGFS